MVQQVLADDGGAGTVEVHGGDVGGVIRDEEVPVHAREHAQEHGAFDAEAVGEGEHGDHDGALRVDEHAHGEEGESDGPGVVLHYIFEAALHHVHVVREVGVGEPGDSVDGDDGDHAALPNGPCYSLLGASLAEEHHERGGGYHDDLDDDVHGERLHLGDSVDHLAGGELRADVVAYDLENGEEHDDAEGAEEDEHGALCLFGDFLVEHGGGAAVHVFLHLRVLEAGLEGGVFIEVEPAPVRYGCCGHEPAEAGGDGDGDDLEVVHFEAVRVRDDDERCDGGGDGRAGDADLGGDGGDTAGAFGADAFFERDVADDGHERVDHMAGAHEHGEEEGADGGEDGDVVGVLAQEAFGYLDEPIHASRCLHDAGAGDGRDDDVDDVGRGLAGLQAETEHEYGEADSRDGAEREAAVTRADV